MTIYKNLAAEYKKANEAKKSRSVHSRLKKEFGIDINARAIKDYLSLSWNEIVNGEIEHYFADMFSPEEADRASSIIAEILDEKQDKEEETETKNETQKNEPKTTVGKDKFEAGFSLNLPIYEMVKEAVNEHAPEIAEKQASEVEQLIKEAAKSISPNIININNAKVGEVKGKTHKEFQEAMDIVVSQKKLFLKGESGTGKTFIAEQIANALNLKFDTISLTAGISEGYLIGRTNIQGEFISTSFIDIYENGGVFLLDEVDASDANTLLILNKAISSNSMPVPMRTENPIAKRHKDFYIICAANTWGNGVGSDYTGREYLDEAFLNRFSAAKLELDYDEELEKELLESELELFGKLIELRKNIRENKLDRLVSTRTMIDAMKYKKTGKSIEQVIDRLTVDYTNEERKKAVA